MQWSECKIGTIVQESAVAIMRECRSTGMHWRDARMGHVVGTCRTRTGEFKVIVRWAWDEDANPPPSSSVLWENNESPISPQDLDAVE